MPINPTAPSSNASVDRLALGVGSSRGTDPSMSIMCNNCMCFDAEPSNYGPNPQPICFAEE